jgi:hypothetical protein
MYNRSMAQAEQRRGGPGNAEALRLGRGVDMISEAHDAATYMRRIVVRFSQNEASTVSGDTVRAVVGFADQLVGMVIKGVREGDFRTRTAILPDDETVSTRMAHALVPFHSPSASVDEPYAYTKSGTYALTKIPEFYLQTLTLPRKDESGSSYTTRIVMHESSLPPKAKKALNLS